MRGAARLHAFRRVGDLSVCSPAVPPNPALQLPRAACGAPQDRWYFEHQDRPIEAFPRRGQLNAKPLGAGISALASFIAMLLPHSPHCLVSWYHADEPRRARVVTHGCGLSVTRR